MTNTHALYACTELTPPFTVHNDLVHSILGSSPTRLELGSGLLVLTRFNSHGTGMVHTSVILLITIT
jgi:hypothetical protein